MHRSATNVNLPSLRDLACVELAKNSVNMSLKSIFRAMGGLKVKLDDFPALAAYIKTGEMHPRNSKLDRKQMSLFPVITTDRPAINSTITPYDLTQEFRRSWKTH